MVDFRNILEGTQHQRTILASELNREDYILESFKRDFPTYKHITYEQVKEFISRSEPVKLWFVSIMESFRITYEMPEVARDLLPETEFMKVKGSLESYTNSLRDEGNEIQKIARKFSDDITKIRKTHQQFREKLQDDKLLEILTLTSDKLPMSYQFKVIEYTEESPNKEYDKEGNVLNKKQYQKKMFDEYLRLLIGKYLKGEDTSQFIKENLLN